FFQAEDGIRDFHVTGVQTCALPIYSFLPFMVLPIYASLEKLDWRLVEAAFDLGANRWQALKRVILPLALPGMLAGSALVFIPARSEERRVGKECRSGWPRNRSHNTE